MFNDYRKFAIITFCYEMSRRIFYHLANAMCVIRHPELLYVFV